MSTVKTLPVWEIAYILSSAALTRYANTRADIEAGIVTHISLGKPGQFRDTPEYARLKRQEHRRKLVHDRLTTAMYNAIRAER